MRRPLLTSSSAPLFESHLSSSRPSSQKPLLAPPLSPSQRSRRGEMPVLMPQAFQRHCVCQSWGGWRRGILGANPGLLIPRGLQLPQTPTPGGGQLYQCRPHCPHAPQGFASLAQDPSTCSCSTKICGFSLTETGGLLFFPVTGTCPAVFQLL